MKLEFYRQIFEESSNIKFYENLSSCPVGAELFQGDNRPDSRTDMTKPTVAFRNFANAPKNAYSSARSVKFTCPRRVLYRACSGDSYVKLVRWHT